MSKIYNLHQILNELDKAYGRNRLSVKLHSVDGPFIYVAITYQKNLSIPEEYLYGEQHIRPHNGILHSSSEAMLRLWFKETPEDLILNKPAEYRLVLYKDAIYTNSYLMPDIREAKCFKEATQALANCLADYLVSNWEVNLGPKLTKQLQTEVKTKYERLQEQITKNLNGKRYWSTTENVETEWREHSYKLKHLLSVIDWVLFPKTNTK